MGILKNAEFAVIDSKKFTRYCLNPDSVDGKHKARVFRSVLGYDLSNYAGLIAAIRVGILSQEAEYVRATAHGVLWRVDLPIAGPIGSAFVRTGWIYKGSDHVPRLVTAFIR